MLAVRAWLRVVLRAVSRFVVASLVVWSVKLVGGDVGLRSRLCCSPWKLVSLADRRIIETALVFAWLAVPTRRSRLQSSASLGSGSETLNFWNWDWAVSMSVSPLRFTSCSVLLTLCRGTSERLSLLRLLASCLICGCHVGPNAPCPSP